MKNTNSGRAQTHNNKQKHNPRKKYISLNEAEIFYSLKRFFDYEIDERGIRKRFPSKTVSRIAEEVFKATVVGSYYAPDIPKGSEKAEIAIRKALETAKATVFNGVMVLRLPLLPFEKPMQDELIEKIKALLQFRNRCEEKGMKPVW